MKIAQILYAGSWGEVTPETIQQGLGGRETAMIKLAEAWAKKGHEVTNFVNVENGRRFNEEYSIGFVEGEETHGNGFHEYLPIQLTRPMLANMPWDAVVTWEMPSIFQDKNIYDNARVKICEMQVAHFPGKEMQAAGEYCDYVAALSKWHGDFLVHSGLEMKKGQVVILPNGVDMSRYPKDKFEEKLRNHKVKSDPVFVYSSSPDRGLWHILKSWKTIRKNFPGAQLQITYGLDKYLEHMRWAHTRQAEMCVEIEELVKQDGVINCGKIGQDALAVLQRKATAWIYPLDPIWPTETGCITAVENAAAGNPLIFTDTDCLTSEFGHFGKVVDMPFDQEQFCRAINKVLLNEDVHSVMSVEGRKFAESRDWNRIGVQWLELFAKDPC